MLLKQGNILKKISYAAAYEISKNKSQSHSQRYINYYILQNLLNALFQLLIILLITYILGVFVEGIIVSIVFSSIRLFSGGYHAKTLNICLIYTTAIVTCISLISHYLSFGLYLIYLNNIIFVFALYIIKRYSPCNNRHSRILSFEKYNRIRLRAIIVTIIWLIISNYLIIKHLSLNIASSICTSVLAVSLLIFICKNSNLIKAISYVDNT